MTRQLLFTLTIVVCAPVVSAAQTLADVARAEEARRKTVKTVGRVYTNNDLKPDFTTPPPPPAPPGPSGEVAGRSDSAPPDHGAHAAPRGSQPSGAEAPAAAVGEKAAPPAAKTEKGEAYWRNRMSTARAELQRSQMFAEALQSRVNALTTDFINRDDPAQRALIEQDRKKTLAELERFSKEIEDRTRGLADLEEEARKAGVPPAWLR